MSITRNEFLRAELASHDTIDVKRIYIDMAGDLIAGIVLSQIVFWHLPNKKGGSKLAVKHDGHVWLAKKREDWWDECRVKPKQLDRCLADLEEVGLIATAVYKFGGTPVKHVRLDWDFFLNRWAQFLPSASDETEAEAAREAEGEIDLPQGGKSTFLFEEGHIQREPSENTDSLSPAKTAPETSLVSDALIEDDSAPGRGDQEGVILAGQTQSPGDPKSSPATEEVDGLVFAVPPSRVPVDKGALRQRIAAAVEEGAANAGKRAGVSDPRFEEKAFVGEAAPMIAQICEMEQTKDCVSVARRLFSSYIQKKGGLTATPQDVLDALRKMVGEPRKRRLDPFVVPSELRTRFARGEALPPVLEY